jgi:hypothetical protein
VETKGHRKIGGLSLFHTLYDCVDAFSIDRQPSAIDFPGGISFLPSTVGHRLSRWPFALLPSQSRSDGSS